MAEMQPDSGILPKMQKALDLSGNSHTIEDVLDAVEAGNARLFFSERAIIIAEIHRFPQGNILHVWLAAGDLADVLSLTEDLYQWGRDEGCEKATLTGRKGWVRVLETDGWALSPMVNMTRDL